MTRSEAGRLGGMATLSRHGREHLRAVGRLGGRPRSPTLAQIQAATAAREVVPIILEKGGELPASLRQLKRLCKKFYGERLAALSPEGGLR